MLIKPEDFLEQKFYLKNIGTSLRDFKEVKNKDKDYFIIGYDHFGYFEKMLVRITNTMQ